MTGKHSGLVTRVKAVAPKCQSIDCFIHREMLATKKLSEELHEVINGVIKVVNFIRPSALNMRIFSVLCEEMGLDHDVLLLHTEGYRVARCSVECLSLDKKLKLSYNQENLRFWKYSVVKKSVWLHICLISSAF